MSQADEKCKRQTSGEGCVVDRPGNTVTGIGDQGMSGAATAGQCRMADSQISGFPHTSTSHCQKKEPRSTVIEDFVTCKTSTEPSVTLACAEAIDEASTMIPPIENITSEVSTMIPEPSRSKDECTAVNPASPKVEREDTTVAPVPTKVIDASAFASASDEIIVEASSVTPSFLKAPALDEDDKESKKTGDAATGSKGEQPVLSVIRVQQSSGQVITIRLLVSHLM